MCFKKRFIFIYKAHSNLICYGLGRKEWYNIMNNYKEFNKIIKQKTLIHYFEHIYRPIMK